MKGIEPSCPAWEAGVLPLNYTRENEEVKVTGERGIVKDQLRRKATGALLDRALNTANILPAAQLFRERTARAVGGISKTEVFVDLE